MDHKVVYGLVKRLDLKPKEGCKLAIFLNRISNKSDQSSGSNAAEDPAQTKLVDDADQEIINCLKRLQIIHLTRPILDLCIQAQTPNDLSKAKSAGIESLIYIPDHITTKLNSLSATLDQSLKNFIDIKETDPEELNKKHNLVVPPNGLELSVVITLVVAAFTMLAFIILKAEDMLGSSEAYYGFFTAGITLLLGINAIIINLIKLLRFKKNLNSLLAEAKRKYVENANLIHSRLKTKIESEGFQIQKIEYSKAADFQHRKIKTEEQALILNLCG
jgi:hypothetical protein